MFQSLLELERHIVSKFKEYEDRFKNLEKFVSDYKKNPLPEDVNRIPTIEQKSVLVTKHPEIVFEPEQKTESKKEQSKT